MTTEPEHEDLRWLLEPPTPGGMHIHIDISPDAEVTPELRTALDQLAQALAAQDEVEGFSKTCTPYSGCPVRSCNLGACEGQECVGRTTCQIQPPSCKVPGFGPPRARIF
jgi:hypothetical protein